jgi:hypothetical protein
MKHQSIPTKQQGTRYNVPEDSHLQTNILFFLPNELFSLHPNLSVLVNILKTQNMQYSDIPRAIAPLNSMFYMLYLGTI